MIDKRDEQSTRVSAERCPSDQVHDQNNSATSLPTGREVLQDVGVVLANLEVGSSANNNARILSARQVASTASAATNSDKSEGVKTDSQDTKDLLLATTKRNGNLLSNSSGDEFVSESQINGQMNGPVVNSELHSPSSSSLALNCRLGSVRSGPACDMADAKRGRATAELNRETGILNNNKIREQYRKSSNQTTRSGGDDDDEQQQERGGKQLDGSNPERRYRPQKYCSVCGDKAIACNFNAVTCESCKAFFRRNAFKEQRLRCLFESCCVIDRVTRRFCSKCRLLKCLQIGMKREWILTDEQKQIKRVKIMQNRQSRQQQQQQVSTTNTTTGNGGCLEELANESGASSSGTAVSCQPGGNQSASGSSSPAALLSQGDSQAGNCRPLPNQKLSVETRDVSVSCPDEADLASGLVLPHCSLAHQCQFCSLRLNPASSLNPHQYHPQYQPIPPHHQQQHQAPPHSFHQHRLYQSHDRYHHQASHATIQASSMYTGRQQQQPPLPHHSQLDNLGYTLGPAAPASATFGRYQMSAIQNEANNESALVYSQQYHYRTHAGCNPIVSTSPSVHQSSTSTQNCCLTSSAPTSQTKTTPVSSQARAIEIRSSGDFAPDSNMFELLQPKGGPSSGVSQPFEESPTACPVTGQAEQSEKGAVQEDSEIEMASSKEASRPSVIPAEPVDESSASCQLETAVATVANDNANQQQQALEASEENLINWKGELFIEPVTKEPEIWARVEKIDFSDTERQLIFEMVAATKPIFDFTDKPPNNTSFEDIVFFCDLALKSLIKTVKKINAFRILPMDDQIILLKNACFKILLLRSCLFYNDEQEGWTDKYGCVKYLRTMKSEQCNNYERHKELLEKLTRPLRRDYLIISFLIMYVLFDPTITLKNANSVALDNLVYLCTLRKYLLCTQPDPLAKYERLAESLRILNACNEEYNLFFSRKFQPEQITPLLIEIFDISVNDPAI